MNFPMKKMPPSDQHMAFHQALIAAMAEHGRHMQAQELLAIASHLVGQLIAMQDQRTMTTRMALDLVMQNIERGNRDAIDPLLTQTGGHA